MNSIDFILGCHSHQPVGNFDFVFKEAYEKSYKPFIDVLERFPKVCVTLHYTGPLWDWFLVNAPDYIKRLAKLVDSGQVEIMGGGYYEPLLCAIPERDAAAQIARMQRFCSSHFGKTPKGMWLTERVWEPRMAKILADAGIEYTVLDDMHFKCSGTHPDDLFGCYVTEDEGATLKIFPIQEKLRYLVPFHPVEESIAWLRDHATAEADRCAVLHDDGEKFGVWPGTYDSVYSQGWLEHFFQTLTDNADAIHCVTYEDYLSRATPAGRTYIPCASYQEMMAWAMPPAMQRRLHALQHEYDPDDDRQLMIRGGFWRSFLAKYPEANGMQKRMLRVSRRLERLRLIHGDAVDAAEKLLHEGQCNCAYWHGVFGGLYLNVLRTAIFEKVIAADVALDALEHTGAAQRTIETTDIDADGQDEVVIDTDRMSLFIDPSDGGTLYEWDWKASPFNVLNTLARREEMYHDALRSGSASDTEVDGSQSIHDLARAKETGLVDFLVYDPYRRSALRDYVFAASTTAQDLRTVQCEVLDDGATAAYDAEVDHGSVRLRHLTRIHVGDGLDMKVEKRIEVAAGAAHFDVYYDLRPRSDLPSGLMFGVEFPVNFGTGDAPDRYYRSESRDLGAPMLGVTDTLEALTHIAARDDWRQLECGLQFDTPATVHCFPIETVSQSEGGQERVHQGAVMVACWPLPPGHSGLRFRIRAEITDDRSARVEE